ncbi:MAG: helicase C-terminal domain-containing protein [Pseudomonadales bacterium]|nr:DEAD/DEAH box helicase family protein [Pseudomonadales bacterium]
MSEPFHVGVKELAEFVHRRGDLFATGGRVTAEEGVRTQARLQRHRPEGYRREVVVEGDMEAHALTLRLRGRADGVQFDAALVEEIKTTRQTPLAAASEHQAQGMLYAALLSRDTSLPAVWTIRTTYVHPDDATEWHFDTVADRTELAEFLKDTVGSFARWLVTRQAVRQDRDCWLAQLRFPMADTRPYQAAMIRRCAEAIGNGERLLLEAPTGSGKTLAVTYPAVRALTNASRLFFLTSRNTGAAAALTAFGHIDPDRRYLSRIALTAREKICPVPGTPCDPAFCERARGYYDRRRAALESLLPVVELTRERIVTVADAHTVCPFELSLDAALWTDVVIGDYNYLFDPVVRLQRFAGDTRAITLIDEAHQLAPRVRESLTVTLQRHALRAAMALAPATLARALRSVDRQLLVLAASVPVAHAAGSGDRDAEPEQFLVPPPAEAFVRALERLVEAAVRYRATDASPLSSEVETCVFDAWRWLQLTPWFERCAYAFVGRGRSTTFALTAYCVDAAAYLHALFGQMGPVLRFSATVSPPDLYQHQHGANLAPERMAFARAGSPFSAEQLGVLVVPDIDTRWRQRARTLAALAQLIREVAGARRGRYLVCLPSYRYLDDLDAELAREPLPEGVHWFRQRPADSDAERATCLERLADAGAWCALGIVLGGIYAESIDLEATPLTGVVAVGVALPPPSVEREHAAAHYTSIGLDGRMLAYIQPGMSKIVQAAGRLIRGPAHRGVLILVDDRYRQPVYRQFFPALWTPRVVEAACVAQTVRDFWTRA